MNVIERQVQGGQPVRVRSGEMEFRNPFGSLLPIPSGELRMSFDSHILSLRTLFDPALAGDLDARLELRLDDQPFRAEVADGRFEIERGESAAPDAIIISDPGTVIAVAHGRVELPEAVRSGDFRIDGDRAVAERFLGVFPLPDPAPVPAAAPPVGRLEPSR